MASIAAIAKKEWQQLSVHDIRNALVAEPQTLAPHFAIGTSISSASANVRHSIVFLPRHTRFTGEFEQSIVACARATGMMLLFCPLVCRSGFFKTFIPMVCQLRGLLQVGRNVDVPLPDVDSLVGALRASQPQPVLPWDVPIMLGLHVAPELDITSKPFGFYIRLEDTDGSFTDATLHLMISAAHVTVELPTWALATDTKMYCWRQTSPISLADSSYQDCGFLLQFSIRTAVPLFTLYFFRGNSRKPIAATLQFVHPTGVVLFEKRYSQLRVSMRTFIWLR